MGLANMDMQKVTFDLGGVLTWDFFEPQQIDQIKADPVGTAVGLLHRQAAAIARGEEQGGYGGLTLVPLAIDDISIELPHPGNVAIEDRYTFVDAKDMRAHIDAGSTSVGAYGELTPDQIDLTRRTFIKVFAPETIAVPRTSTPITVQRSTFASAVEGPREEPRPDVNRPVRSQPPEEPPYDGIISSGPVS